jgi:hypothetical protein
MPDDMVTVYSYRCWDTKAGCEKLMPTKATVEGLARLDGCTPIAGTGEEVPLAAVDEEGLYLPLAVQTPQARGSRAAGVPRSESCDRAR